jgi:hypothetical protein
MAKWDLGKLSNVSKKGKPMTKYTRTEILDTAKQYITKDRAATHGDMEENLTTIAELWGVYLERHVDPSDVAVMMTMLKIARIKSNPRNADNWLDACGYMACGGELSADKTEPEPVVKFQGGNT